MAKAQVTNKRKNKAGVERKALGRGLEALLSPRPRRKTPVDRQAEDIEAKVSENRPVDSVKADSSSEVDAGIVAKRIITSANLPSEESEQAPETIGEPTELSLDSLVPCPTQPRQIFTEEEIEALRSSIEQSGVIQPLLVRRTKERGQYEIVAGERRYRAAQKAGLTSVPVVVKELSDKDAFALSIVENVQRENLNPIEEARAYKRLIDEFGDSQTEVAKRVGKDRATIANLLRLLNLNDKVLNLLQNGKLSAGHGRALASLSEPAMQNSLAQRVILQGLSVRATEKLCQKYKDDPQSGDSRAVTVGKRKATSVLELEERLRRSLGTKVSLDLKANGKGELKIAFYSQDELSKMLERLL